MATFTIGALAGFVLGIGFTIAIFISTLAFEEQELQDQSKVAILVGSTVAAVIGLAVLFTRHHLAQRR